MIAGDTSSDFDIFNLFITNLSRMSRGPIFLTLGNHELWDKKFYGMKLEKVIEEYRTSIYKLENKKVYFVHNNLFFLNDSGWNELSTETLMTIAANDLRLQMKGTRLIIFGGIGFAGKNNEFNANNGLYLNILSRDEEIMESEKFYDLYEKVTGSLEGMNLIILTHMPISDWGGNIPTKDGVIYVNGHNHRNYYCDKGKKKIYADNQVGYKGKNVFFKTFLLDFEYNWFADYANGIYEITKEDYERFYRGIGEKLTFNREFMNLYMIKRDETYMFLTRSQRNNLYVLNGGSIKKVGNHDLDYFYDNIVQYSTSVSMSLSKYNSVQKEISNVIKKIGGTGDIHGSIVDIDFYSHIYLNPLDGKITSYFAYSMIDKYVYDSIPLLLEDKCPKLYKNYKSLMNKTSSNPFSITNQAMEIPKNIIYDDSTEMYRISRIVKGLQFTTKYKIVRLWNDNLIFESSMKNSEPVSLKMIDSSNASGKNGVKKKIKNKNNKIKPKEILSIEEISKKRYEDYKSKIAIETSSVEVLKYINSKTKAKYKCNSCGNEWETRPDHFKDRQGYKCPKCKK